LKALTSSVFDADGTKLNVSIPLAPKKQQVSNSAWKGEYHDDKLYVAGIPNLITKTEVLCVFAEYGDAEVQMMHNSAFVSYGNKRHAARALDQLHKQFSFPGSSRHIYVRFARKLLNNAAGPKIPQKHKPSKVARPLNFAHASMDLI
jgi:hypothetical protein